MIEVAGVYRYPLTGARAESLDVATVVPAGIEGDRTLLLYDAMAETEVKPRISQLQSRGLATISALHGESATELYIANYGNFYARYDQASEAVTVNEFGDETPCHDTGDDHARRFQRLLGREGVRLARKSGEWLAGDVIHPSERSNRPIHIVSAVTLRELQARARELGVNDTFEADRFRPNILLDGDLPAFEENDWAGERIVIGEVAYSVIEPTARCPVPGNNQKTGQSMKDVPKLYRGLPQNAKGKPLFGVYAYPVLEIGDSAELAVGMPVAA